MPQSLSRRELRKPILSFTLCLALSACAGGGTDFDGTSTSLGDRQMAAVAIGAVTGNWDETDLGSKLDIADKVYAQRTTQDALEYNKVAQVSTWRNPDSGNSGTITPMRTFVHSSGKNCRTFSTSIFVSGDQEKGAGIACRQTDGTWQIES
ncbi:RT0821/Lpp0805 family surface protein [Rhodospirillales bacterium]|jgi:surface antigen|nr:RT0821/Lpp0805 family surface protein [Rhodospirillales bacterium]